MRSTGRYFAGARAAAVRVQEEIEIASDSDLEALCRLLARRHGQRLDRVLAVCTFLLDEISTPRDQLLRDAATVDVLPPFAGG